MKDERSVEIAGVRHALTQRGEFYGYTVCGIEWMTMEFVGRPSAARAKKSRELPNCLDCIAKESSMPTDWSTRAWPRRVAFGNVVHKESATHATFTRCNIYFGDGWVDNEPVVTRLGDDRAVDCIACIAEGA